MKTNEEIRTEFEVLWEASFRANTPDDCFDVSSFKFMAWDAYREAAILGEQKIAELEDKLESTISNYDNLHSDYTVIKDENASLQVELALCGAACAEKDTALKAQISWHEEYDEYGGWPESDLALQTHGALAISTGQAMLARMERIKSTISDLKSVFAIYESSAQSVRDNGLPGDIEDAIKNCIKALEAA